MNFELHRHESDRIVVHIDNNEELILYAHVVKLK